MLEKYFCARKFFFWFVVHLYHVVFFGGFEYCQILFCLLGIDVGACVCVSVMEGWRRGCVLWKGGCGTR